MPKYIDVHHHFLPPFYRDALVDTGILQRSGISLPNWTLDASKSFMDKYQVSSAITSISAPGVSFADKALAKKLARRCNDFAAELSSQYPKVYGGFATLPLPNIDDSLLELIYALDVLKMEGVILLSNYEGKILGNPVFDPIFEELNKRQSAAFVHPTFPSPCCTDMNYLPATMFEILFDSTRAVINLLFSGIFEKYPNIKFIVPHGGGVIPFLAGRLDLFQKLMPALSEKAPKSVYHYLKNLYFDTGMSTSDASLSCLREFVSAEKMLLGTEYPFVNEAGIETQLKALEQYPHFSSKDRELIYHQNMETLFPRFKV